MLQIDAITLRFSGVTALDGVSLSVDEGQLVQAIREIFPLSPKGIIDYLNLRRPIFKKTAAYGHFGRTEPEFSWEQTGKAAELKAFFKL